uniref:Uncharacterized protein n=1 Tax=Grammatophora oceanica TaxID=210454 RepID=A0A7S1YEL1_9STRA|eukprot:CAMPEP_0194053702 /NCGR_PEP_ID=MMETSP0009_2-20130614/50896_1 /TAXON_ID=210454 /ORGANISM="Grammatophora oceanica, Strain CCMP 410" /LENGTH=411 /DNA_ID=CAMNT_0038701919 /DNA_START=6 /DNA_END=1241 /DNA_ORIENTATION=+
MGFITKRPCPTSGAGKSTVGIQEGGAADERVLHNGDTENKKYHRGKGWWLLPSTGKILVIASSLLGISLLLLVSRNSNSTPRGEEEQEPETSVVRRMELTSSITSRKARPIDFVSVGEGTAHPPGDVLDDLEHVSAYGEVGLAYRLGDVFALWHLHHISFPELVGSYALDYPHSIALWYLLAIRQPENGYRNLTALVEVMDWVEENDLIQFPKPQEDELVIHLRLGDVLTAPICTDLSVPIEDMWNGEEGFINKDEGLKSNYNKAEFRELVDRIPDKARKQIKKCVLVGATFVNEEEQDHRNREYVALVESFFEEHMGCEVLHFDCPNPDKTMLFMASANWMIGAMGGYAQIAAACVNARRGRGHAIYDKFNGEIASWSDDRLSEEERRIYREEYIDWSQVRYQSNATTSL